VTGKLYQFNYQIIGNKKSPKLLFLHGFMGDMTDWSEVVELLKDRYQCMILDLPGHGRTQVFHPRGYQFTECATGIVDLIEHLKFHPSYIIGYSMGGRLALYLTLNSAKLFHALVLESASAGIEGAAERCESRKHDLQLASKLQQEWPDFLYSWYDQPLFVSTRLHQKFFKLLQHRMKNNPQQLGLVLEGMGQGKQSSLWSRLPDINSAVYLLVGGQDRKYVTLSKKMAKGLPNCSRILFDGCSHNIHFEDPDRFAAELEHIVQNQATQNTKH
jgi:2-succinyl-6-hydroxy-2,4-cyclohexadiene-1-carboxylate synthase